MAMDESPAIIVYFNKEGHVIRVEGESIEELSLEDGERSVNEAIKSKCKNVGVHHLTYNPKCYVQICDPWTGRCWRQLVPCPT